MSRTVINVSAIVDAKRSIDSAKTYIGSAKSSFSQTKNGIDSKIKNRSNISNRLSTVQNQLSSIDSKIGRIRSTVQSGANQYRSTDDKVETWRRDLKNDVGAGAVSGVTSHWASFFKDFDDIEKIEKKEHIFSAKPYIITSVLNIISPVSGLLYITSGAFYGRTPSVLDSNRTSSSNASAEWLGYEFTEGNPGITAWVGKASAEAQNEWGYAGVNAYLGKAEAEVDADFAFMKTTTKKEKVDGKWVEKTVTEFVNAEVSAGVSASVAAVDAEAGLGSDMLGIEGEAKGSVGNAKAEGKAEFSITEDGVNANVQGEAMVSAAEGEVEGTINILGIEITGKVGGYAGALGVEGKAGIEDNKFVLEGGAAALLGVSAGVEIGFNDEGWDNFVDFITFWD